MNKLSAYTAYMCAYLALEKEKGITTGEQTKQNESNVCSSEDRTDG